MRNILLMFATVFCSHYCFCQSGSISGNAFWKYNDYIGTKYDAGSSVYIFSTDTTQNAIVSTCDGAGNFKVENIPDGKYLVLIRSKNTTTDGWFNFSQFTSTDIKPYLGQSLKEADPILFDSVGIYSMEHREASVQNILNKSRKNKKTLYKNELNAKHKLDNAIRNVFVSFKNVKKVDPLYLWLPFPNKVYVTEVEVVGGKSSPVVADFGTTYL